MPSVRRATNSRSGPTGRGEASSVPTAAGGVKDKLLLAGDPLLNMCEMSTAGGTKASACFLLICSDNGGSLQSGAEPNPGLATPQGLQGRLQCRGGGQGHRSVLGGTPWKAPLVGVYR